MRAHSRSKDVVAAVVLLAVAVGVFLWGVRAIGVGEESDGADGRLGTLAERAACRPELVADEQEYRVASCEAGGARLVLAAFASERGLREWVDDTIIEGSYLEGDLWIAYGRPEVLPGLQRRLGGTVRSVRP
ncbi:hypothetical protein [Streptomyces sp. NPDC059176]|uniref:hypothetical protein n=1 Tax=unclassified Streptomyces TaxID=2593676 RepID=UPI0036BB60B5